MHARTRMTLAGLATGAVLLATGCASAAPAATLENGDEQTIDLAVFAGWPEGIAVSELWAAVLEEQGYEVNMENADVAPVYLGLSDGDYDLVLDTWMPITHEAYWDQYGDDLVDLGAWYTDARNTIVVNEDSPITSLDELAENADLFGNRIVGMEPGAGLTKITEEQAIPTYGLEEMTFQTSSTAALLTELQRATDAGEDIVATLARPHWAYDAFPIRDLEDPEGAMGEAEEIRTTASTEFEESHPTAAEWMRGFAMTEEQLLSLCNLLFNENAGTDDYRPLVEQWIGENQEFVDGLTA